MSRPKQLAVVRLAATVRFVRGYRYLDRCGEALFRLEQNLDEGWIPGEVSPKGGQLANYRLGLRARFDSESLAVQQIEYMSFEHFQDQTCKIYDILRSTFEIERILTPSLLVIMQIGFEEMEKAGNYLLQLKICQVDGAVLNVLGGRESAIRCTVCTEDDITRDGNTAVQRRRLDVQAIRQERQPDFDERIMRRLPLLPVGQRKGVGDLMKLRRQYPKAAPAAVQFDVENACEGELLTRTFDLGSFLEDSWKWSHDVRDTLQAIQKEPCQG